MTELVWDQIGDRIYESGIDRGVIYLPGGVAIPWNGLTSVTEKFDKQTTPVYFDGRRIQNLVSPGNFSGTITAITYPDELSELEGLGFVKSGVFVGDQIPKVFDLSYRTRVGNDLDPDFGYKIHILYNVTVIPKDKGYTTISDSPGISEFEWDLLAVPEDVDGFHPSAHVIFDSTHTTDALMSAIEEMLYGSDTENASLLSMSELIPFLDTLVDIQVVDNGDGTWTLTTDLEDVVFVDDGVFTLSNVNATFIDEDTYSLSES